MFKYVLTFCLFIQCFADNIKRPCHIKDYKCIGDNLSANSVCNRKVDGFIPHKYNIPKYKFGAPSFASNYIETNLIITNMDKCHVSDYFINKDTDVAVLCVSCPMMNFDTDRTLVQHATCEEDKHYHYHFNGTYPLIKITMNLKKSNNFNICTTDAYTEVTDLPIFNIDPKDKRTEDFLTQDLSMLWNFVIEDFDVRGRYLMRDVVNHYLCDYGCPYVYTDDWF
uniref:Fibrohexamerin 1 n=1 Tax=Tineola bisselliella TaxID=93883 RepID=A0A891XHI1_TINBI|nr:fibrohexamerin 1 [Tineola bisselliella]